MPDPAVPPAPRPRGSRRAAWGSAACGAIALLAAACGGSDAPPDARPAETATPVAAEATAPAEATAGPADEGREEEAAPDATAPASRVAGAGDTVKVHYHGTLDSGEVFDSSLQRAPLTFTVGSGQVIEGFDDAVRGLAVGESVSVRLEPEQAYGERDPAAVMTVWREGAPEGLAVGDHLQLDNGLVVTVVGISETEIHLDLNHPLAGMALTFEIELVGIE